MIQTTTNNRITYITVGDSIYEFPETLEGISNNDEFLSKVSMEDLYDLFRYHGGIPNYFKEILEKKAKLYGDSLEASSFICEGNKVWLDKQQRSSILNLLNSLKEDKFELVLHGKIHELETTKVLALLPKLEVFAYKCLVNTTKHLQNIAELKTLKDIMEYDYTTGYPEKLILE